MDNNSANPYLSPEETNSNGNKQLCHSHLFGSVVFLLSWTPSMMEKELAGSNSSLSSSYRQWAAVRANLLPICLIMMVIQQIRKYAVLHWLVRHYQNAATLAVDEVRFNVLITKKRSNPRIGINLEKEFEVDKDWM